MQQFLADNNIVSTEGKVLKDFMWDVVSKK